jgi:Kef-type K+ transport system membrane component KefB
MNNLDLALQFFLQLAVILLFCWIVGAIAARLGQPQVGYLWKGPKVKYSQ